ncbi:MAG: M66 family metalloprotease [Gammaproteobacteria bacterium]|nr:M66 family metalloprotease [Gammaproteobacteria bacterium]
MTRGRLRVWVVGSLAVLLAVCSDGDDPAMPSPPHPEETDIAGRDALIAFYNATGGPNWHEGRNWLTSERIRFWHGVSTNSDGFVTELVLDDNNLSGTLPPELGDLTQLRRLVLDDNELTGPIPPELGKLSRLTRLDLSWNGLSGTIPAELAALPLLDSLELWRNELSGSIPVELSSMRSLRRLSLAWNQLSGPVPPELGRLGNLTDMTLSRNELTGTIPPELANLPAIQSLSVSRNNLTGTIPPELGELATLEGLYLYDNELTGEIPVSLGNLRQLEILWIHENGLSGALPGFLANLTELQSLSVANNRLTGALPRDLHQLQDLVVMELQGNRDLTGLLPRPMLDLKLLRWLKYGETGLCAQIDDDFQAWLGIIPEVDGTNCDVGQVERLALTSVHDLTDGPSWANRTAWATEAPLGDWHGVATEGGRVVDVALPGNGLSGPLPGELANLKELTALDLTGNGLSGAFPPAIALLRELAELRVGRNAGLEGALPFDLRRLTRLQVLLHDDTGLCASPSPDFQAWYTAIERTAGAVCDNPDYVTVSLPMVYLTQSIQTPSGRVRLVANRDALVRAFVTAEEPRGFFEPEVVAVFTRPGRGEVHRATMSRDANQIPAAADEGDLELSYNAVIPAEIIVPGVELVVAVDPEGTLPLTAESETRFPREGSHSLNVVQVAPMHLTLVPVMEAEEPDTSALAWVRGVSAESPQVGLLKHAFPFGEFSVSPHEPYFTSLDLTTRSGRSGLLGELDALRASEGGTGYYYGAAASVNGFVRGWAQLPGWVSMGGASPTTLAHEIGHNLSLQHAPCGNPDYVNRAFPYPDGSIGVWGYDFRDGSVVPPGHSKDIMTYCYALPWVSDFHFNEIIDHRAQLAAGAASTSAAAGNATSDMLVLWGGAVDGELWIDPAFSMRAAARPPEASGPYRLQGTAPDGRTLFSVDFTPTEDKHGGRHFFFMVPIEAEWGDALERITLTGPEGETYVDQADERRITVVTEPGTGRLRAILRDWEGALPDALRDEAGLVVSMTRGLREAVRLRR